MAKNSVSHRSPIGYYRAGITEPDRLEKTIVGREEILRDLLDKLERSTRKKTHQHYVFIGPRGVGKTALLSLLVHRIESSELNDKFTIVRFAEETHRLLSFADFLLRICEILAQTSDNPDWQELFTDLHEEDDDLRIIDTLQPKLNQYRKKTGRLLLLLVENLDEILSRQIKDSRDIHHLRKFLMASPSCILIASSPLLFPGLTDVRQPLYDFFDIQILDNLTQEQTVEVIRGNLEYDQCQDLLDRFDELSPKIKALHEMTGGNPRLVMLHYSLIVDADILEVKQQFEELLDQISPFYLDRIKELPPQERAILETMALIRAEPKTPALLARKLRKSPQQTSSLLKRLTRSGYLVVMDHPSDKRSKTYRIKEGFFDLWLSMNKSRAQRKRLPALVQFFELWFQREEREKRRRALVDRLLGGQPIQDNLKRCITALDHLCDTGAEEEKIAAKAQFAAALKSTGLKEESVEYLEEIKVFKPTGIVRWLTDHWELWTDDMRWSDPIKQVEEMIAIWELQRAGDLEEFSARLVEIGASLQAQGLHRVLVDLLLASADEIADDQTRNLLLSVVAKRQKTIGDLQGALTTLEKVLQFARERTLRDVEAMTLNGISTIYHAWRQYDKALKCLEQALAIQREVGDRPGQATTLNNLSQIYDAQEDYDNALLNLEQALAIRREVDDRHGEGITLNNLSHIYHARGDYDQALTYLNQTLDIAREQGNREIEGKTLNNISAIHLARQDYDQGQQHVEQALVIANDIGDRVGLCSGLINLGHFVRNKLGFYEAFVVWLLAYQLAKEIGHPEALHALDHLPKHHGREEGLGYWEALLELVKKNE